MSDIAADLAPPMAATRDAVLTVENLAVHFDVSGGKLRAVDGVSFTIGRGETLALVGESGCGKSSVGRAIVRLVEPSAGRIVLSGDEITGLSRRSMKPYRQRVQMVFQDPYASLNPRQRVGSLVGEPLGNFGVARGADKAARVRDLLRRVGLPAAAADKYPHEFSGGQRQRVGIARALALEPHLIVADEPVSALDVSIQAQVLNLLIDLQNERGLAYLFISHDILVVEHISHRVAVMYLGKIVEIAEKRAIFAAPQHPYTEALFQSAPVPDPRRPRTHRPLAGEVPSPMNPPSGCHFHPRCPYAVDRCRSEAPVLRETQPGHYVSCHLR